VPKPTILTINPRYYEFDADGMLHPAHYLHIMLQAALESGAITDTNQPELKPADWLRRIGDVGVQITEPIVYGENIEVQTEVARVDASVWRRKFTLKRPASGVLAATGFVDLFEDEDTIHDETAFETEQAAHWPADSDSVSTWDGPVPDPPQSPSHAFRSTWRVAWPNLDLSGTLDPAWLIQILNDMDNRAAEIQG